MAIELTYGHRCIVDYLPQFAYPKPRNEPELHDSPHAQHTQAEEIIPHPQHPVAGGVHSVLQPPNAPLQLHAFATEIKLRQKHNTTKKLTTNLRFIVKSPN